MSGGQPGDAVDPVELRFAFCDAVSPADAERLHRNLLSAEEDARFARFHDDRDRHAYLLAHALTRRALSSRAAIAPQEWTFAATEFGKPFVSSPAGPRLEFNLSHTRDAVACAVARSHPVGVDVQADPGPGKIFSLAQHVFSERELATLLKLSPADRDRAATRLWTLKEALAKAVGIGIRLPFPKIDFCLESDQPPRLRSSPPEIDGANWRFACFEIGPEHWLSLAVPGPPDRPLNLRVCECVGPDLVPVPVELPAGRGTCWRLRPSL